MTQYSVASEETYFDKLIMNYLSGSRKNAKECSEKCSTMLGFRRQALELYTAWSFNTGYSMQQLCNN